MGGIVILTAVGIALYTLWIFSKIYTSQIDLFISTLLLILLNLMLFTFGLYLIFIRGFNLALRLAWFFFSLSALSKLLAHAFWFYNQVMFSLSSFPSLADIFHMLFYPLFLLGLVFYVFVFIPRKERSLLWLDTLVLFTFLGTMVWYYILASPQFSFGGNQPGDIQWLIYPVGDFLILASIITLIQRDLTRTTRWVLSYLALAMFFLVIGDLFLAYSALNQLPYKLAFLNVFWMCAVQVEILAAARQITCGAGVMSESPARFSPFRQILRLALPYLAVTFGLALLAIIIYVNNARDSRLMGVLYGVCALVGFVLLRQYVVLRENVRLYQRMRRVAWTDSLTGLYNRHFFNEILPREMERARRYEKQLSIMLLDIDGFKQYNDTYGHLKGDIVLRNIAQLCLRQLRSTDTIARFGGDEFVVILPETNQRMAWVIAQRIKNAVKEQFKGRVRLSISVGIALFEAELTPEQFLDRADKDLYDQKSHKLKDSTGEGVKDITNEEPELKPNPDLAPQPEVNLEAEILTTAVEEAASRKI